MHLTFRSLLAIVPLVAAPVLEARQDADDAPALTSETLNGLSLRSIGPAFMSGRIADIAIHPTTPNTRYIAVGSGGVWKTVNAGTTWSPIFDDQTSYSIGCIAIDPTQPSTVWVGTGENVGGRHVGYGDGIYRSLDGGSTWENMGLADTQHIGRIAVDPRDSKVVYVAAQGPLWSAGGERGLFKTVDGGATWTAVLTGGEYTGVNDVVLDPRNPDILYASTHQHLRTVAALVNAGPDSGIHKSIDGGATWRKLTTGLPTEDMGRIGLALSPQQPDVVYATIELGDRRGGFYRSADSGASWEKRSDYASGGTGPHYYQEIFASPHAFDRIYHMDVYMHVSHDGGTTFERVGEEDKHVDNHALAFSATDPDYLMAGCDGGIYESWDLGKTWRFTANLPITQFYKVALDTAEPFYNVYGGTQDNNTQGGPSRTDNVQGIRSSDWFVVLGGDGHQPACDPENPNIVYAQWQQGNLCRWDRKTGEITYVKPQPAADEPSERYNWDAPILVSPHASATLLHGSQRVWQSDDRGDSWRPISGDLSRGIDRLTQPVMGRVWSVDAGWDVYAMSKYGTITSLAQSPLDAKLIYAGTDDGLIQVTEDGGENWRRVDQLPDVPEYFFVNDIKADLFDADTAYAVVDDHKSGDFAPYVLKTTDRGRSWVSIAGNLPERHVLWRIVQDHVRPELLFLGTEFGLYFTVDGGSKWTQLKGGVPTIPFRDLAIQRRENDLVGATFGRGFYVLDDYAPLREVSEEALEQEAILFPVRDAWWYAERRPLGDDGRASQGASYYTADNPPFGATFTYYLKDAVQTRREARQEREKEIAEEGGDTPTPGWEALREEDLELPPRVLLTILDSTGKVVRRLNAPTGSGVQRVTWDLRHPSSGPWSSGEEEEDGGDDSGFLAAPGTYRGQLGTLVDGVYRALGSEQEFRVFPLHDGGTLPGLTPIEATAFLQRLQRLQRGVQGAGRVLSEAQESLTAARLALGRTAVPDMELPQRVQSLSRQIAELRLTLSGEPRRDRFNDPGPVSISDRLGAAMTGNWSSTQGPTKTQMASVEIAEAGLLEMKVTLDDLVKVQLPALAEALDQAGVPWTPGRSIPTR